ncbi:MAG TPA: GNAT family N-acetyltransferase [Gemmatimonadaceae bacterium]
MRATVIPAAELSADLAATWRDTLASNALLSSPLLQPEIYRIIGRHYPRAMVAVADDAHGKAFLPFARGLRLASFAESIPLCDYQTVVAPTGARIDLRALLRAAGLQTWTFDHLLANDALVGQTVTTYSEPSRRVVIPRGYEAYAQELKSAGKSGRNVRTKLNLLARDHGPLTFRMDSRDPRALHEVLEWKAARFEGGPAPAWIRRTLEDLLATREASLTGVLSTLHAGDSLVAAHFGVRSGTTLYYWFPGFNPGYGKYTPGWLLLLHMLQQLESLGCDMLDLGPGGENYKDYFSNSQVIVHRGHVELPTAVNFARATWRSVDRVVRTHPLSRAVLRPIARVLRRGRK